MKSATKAANGVDESIEARADLEEIKLMHK